MNQKIPTDNSPINLSNGKTITKKFDKEVQLPGSTLFQLWNEKNGDKIIAHNIYSGWYVLIETDPPINLSKI